MNQSELKSLVSSILDELLKEKFDELISKHEKQVKKISILKRLLRVEKELKALRKLEDKRFEALIKEINKSTPASKIKKNK
ncbi:MAG: hypothetical protein RMI35_09865 [Leptospiraceae bacterium]|nr:hypothetical protein [Leptospiraceae bacterium]